MTQPILFDIPPAKPKRIRKPTPQSEATISQTLARYAREAAEIRSRLRQAQIDEDLRTKEQGT